MLGLMNSKITYGFMQVLGPTLNFEVGNLAKLPVTIDDKYQPDILRLSKLCIELTKQDWDQFEISMDFRKHPLIRNKNRSLISIEYAAWKDECSCRFINLKKYEEEINTIFIKLYNLETYVTPNEENVDISVHEANLSREIRSLLSYAIGCMFGRYSFDVDGLAYAGGDWDASKYSTFNPDADNVIPITDEDYFDDDIVGLLIRWLKKVYGEDTLEENLDFIAKALGNKGNTSREIIRNYFLMDFFKDHCQTYSVAGSGKRPIYWLYDSGKQNGFKALIYMHRYNEDTTGVVRVKYLHRMEQIYMSEIDRMQDMMDHSKSAHDVSVASKRKEKLQKQLKECRDYDEKLSHLALDRIAIDLDDGVKVNYRKVQTGSDGKFYEVLADSKNIMSKQ